MGRLIDADEYEKRIKPYDTEDVMDKALYNFAHGKLVTTPTAQPDWIPCNERLPEHELVLVQFSDGDFDLLQFPTVYRRKDMVAWMSLPEPYKEDTDE